MLYNVKFEYSRKNQNRRYQIRPDNVFRRGSHRPDAQNFSNKLKKGDFRESELRAIAEALGCELKISFIDKTTGEEI